MASILDVTFKRHNGSDDDTLHPSTNWNQVADKPTTFTPTTHALIGHTVSGLTTGHFLKATGASTYGFAAHGLTYNDVGAAATSHTHGDITAGGQLSAAVTVGSGDYFLITDSSNSNKIQRAIAIGTGTTTFLRNDGTWAAAGTAGTYDRATSVLTGTNVFSDIVVNDGLVTAISTRALTLSSFTVTDARMIGRNAGSAGGATEMTAANVQTFLGLGTAAYTASTAYRASTWVPTWSDVTSKPTTFAPIIGSGAGDAVAGNDARLSDARTPLSHTHGNITNVGAIGTTSGLIVKTTTSGVLTTLAAGTALQYLRGDGTWGVPAGTVTSVFGTSPVLSSGGGTPTISLDTGYGDTKNPYASKTAKYVLAAPNAAAGVPTFRALVASDIPALSYAATSHAHGNITSAGAIGSTASLMVKTTTSGVLTTLTAGTTAQFLRGDGTWATPSYTTPYVHPTTDGYYHFPQVGSGNSGKVVICPASGGLSWSTPPWITEAVSMKFVTSCPTSANTDGGMRIYKGTVDCANKFDGYWYIII